MSIRPIGQRKEVDSLSAGACANTILNSLVIRIGITDTRKTSLTLVSSSNQGPTCAQHQCFSTFT